MKLTIREGDPLSDEWTTRPFEATLGFNDNWWIGSVKGPVVFCSFTTDDHGEVARAMVRPHSTLAAAYPDYARSRTDSTEIDLLEVRADLQHRGFGPTAVGLLLAQFPAPCIAASLNARSDRFWSSLGWAPYPHENDRGATLFVQPG